MTEVLVTWRDPHHGLQVEICDDIADAVEVYAGIIENNELHRFPELSFIDVLQSNKINISAYKQ